MAADRRGLAKLHAAHRPAQHRPQELKYSAADVLAAQRLLSALDGRAAATQLSPDADYAAVQQQAESLRTAALPPAAAVAGAATVAELSAKLLHARYDVG